MTTRLDFPARGDLPAVSLHWYQGMPPVAVERGLAGKTYNTLFIGNKGELACGFDRRKLLPEETFAGFAGPDPAMPPSPGSRDCEDFRPACTVWRT